jgi:chemotaxis protein MotB
MTQRGRKRGQGEGGHEPVTIRRPARHKGEHHGGSWKVAYADFVTTMMALFIVLWAAGQDTHVRESVAAYFRNPSVVPVTVSGGSVMPASTGIVASADLLANEPSPDRDGRLLRDVAAQITGEIERAPDLRPLLDQIQVAVTAEGLRVEISERDESLFFEIGSARVKPALVHVLRIVAAAVGKIPNGVIVEGHTDSRPYTLQSRFYSNWELSADRANAARRILATEGLRAGQVARVVGFADQDLRMPGDPLNARNRRVSVLVERRQERTALAPAPDPARP